MTTVVVAVVASVLRAVALVLMVRGASTPVTTVAALLQPGPRRARWRSRASLNAPSSLSAYFGAQQGFQRQTQSTLRHALYELHRLIDGIHRRLPETSGECGNVSRPKQRVDSTDGVMHRSVARRHPMGSVSASLICASLG